MSLFAPYVPLSHRRPSYVSYVSYVSHPRRRYIARTLQSPAQLAPRSGYAILKLISARWRSTEMCPCDGACMTVRLVENHMQSFFLCHFPARCTRAHILPFSVVYYFFEYFEYFVVYKIHMQCCAERYSELRTQVSVANETSNCGIATPTRSFNDLCFVYLSFCKAEVIDLSISYDFSKI